LKQKTNKKRARHMAVIAAVAVLLTAAATVYIFFFTDKLAKQPPRIEYGQPVPPPEAWFSRMNHAYTVQNVGEISTNAPGEYSVTLVAGNKTREVSLYVLDTTPPVVTVKTVYALVGEKLSPEDFIARTEDVCAVTYEFSVQPDTSREAHGETQITATDAYGNAVTVTGQYTVISVKQAVTYSYEDRPVFFVSDIASEFGEAWLELVSYPTDEELKVPGKYEAVILYGGKKITCEVSVTDSTPPVAAPKQLTVFQGQRP
jgi:hypothetical protein